MEIIGNGKGNERIAKMTVGEINDLQWIAGTPYQGRKQDVGITVDIGCVKEAIDTVLEMRKFKKEIRSMMVKFKKLSELLDDREDMD
jgi:hypothetical protein